MARQKGSNIFAGTLEPLAGGPLDARAVVPTKSDLTVSGNFPYPYVGMVVAVQNESKLYILNNMDYTNISSWSEVSGGGSGSGDLTYIHEQSVPAVEWQVTHNLNKYPSVTVVDSAKTTICGEVTYINPNSLIITFSSAFSGTAYCN